MPASQQPKCYWRHVAAYTGRMRSSWGITYEFYTDRRGVTTLEDGDRTVATIYWKKTPRTFKLGENTFLFENLLIYEDQRKTWIFNTSAETFRWSSNPRSPLERILTGADSNRRHGHLEWTRAEPGGPPAWTLVFENPNLSLKVREETLLATHAYTYRINLPTDVLDNLHYE